MAKNKADDANKGKWFKVYVANRQTFEAISNESLGAAFKEALRYCDESFFSDGEIVLPEIKDEAARIAFETLRAGIESSKADYRRSVVAGKKSQEERRRKQLEEEKNAAYDAYGGPEPFPQPTKKARGLRGAKGGSTE